LALPSFLHDVPHKSTLLVSLSFIVAALAVIVLLVRLPGCESAISLDQVVGTRSFAATIYESIPDQLELDSNFLTADGWLQLINAAQSTLEIACYYMTLRDAPAADGQTQGLEVFDAILAAADRGVDVRIAYSQPAEGSTTSTDDVAWLSENGYATVVPVDIDALLGGGILHTKFIIADRSSFYVGSANMDWRSLQQVKELGVLLMDAPELAIDLGKVFDIYWYIGSNKSIPSHWPASWDTPMFAAQPGLFSQNAQASVGTFLTAAPPELTTPHRTHDDEGMVDLISGATATVCLSVMDYSPLIEYATPKDYYAVLDDALRRAATPGVQATAGVIVRMLISHWDYTRLSRYAYLESLMAIPNIEVRIFEVPHLDPAPADPTLYDHTRVNHAKYLVSDKMAFVSTSNFIGDYFVDTCGVGFVTNDERLREHVQTIFDRDWNSQYSHALSEYYPAQ
jgi:phospholipase D3/4